MTLLHCGRDEGLGGVDGWCTCMGACACLFFLAAALALAESGLLHACDGDIPVLWCGRACVCRVLRMLLMFGDAPARAGVNQGASAGVQGTCFFLCQVWRVMLPGVTTRPPPPRAELNAAVRAFCARALRTPASHSMPLSPPVGWRLCRVYYTSECHSMPEVVLTTQGFTPHVRALTTHSMACIGFCAGIWLWQSSLCEQTSADVIPDMLFGSPSLAPGTLTHFGSVCAGPRYLGMLLATPQDASVQSAFVLRPNTMLGACASA